jgi:orotidine-5'-phosphate decarboxylase
MKDKIYIALDVDSYSKAINLSMRLSKYINNFKVGLELFTRAGPYVVDRLKEQGGNVFLDLKFHDIDNTTIKAIRNAALLEVDIINIHLMNSYSSLSNISQSITNEFIKLNKKPPKIVGVTVLTTITEKQLKEDLLIPIDLEDYVLHLSRQAKRAGLDGIICSALEVRKIKNALGYGFITVTPGIRLPGNDNNEQSRVCTPKQAILNGSDYLVIGRPITASDSPEQACIDILDSLKDI